MLGLPYDNSCKINSAVCGSLHTDSRDGGITFINFLATYPLRRFERLYTTLIYWVLYLELFDDLFKRGSKHSAGAA